VIKPLRKRHLQIWIAWAVLLPVGIAVAYISVKRPATIQLLQPPAGTGLPVIIKSVDNERYSIALLGNPDSTQLQLQWVNMKVLSVPTATIYKVAAGSIDLTGAVLLGRLEARGTYYFPVDSGFLREKPDLVVYDFIHNKVLDTIKF